MPFVAAIGAGIASAATAVGGAIATGATAIGGALAAEGAIATTIGTLGTVAKVASTGLGIASAIQDRNAARRAATTAAAQNAASKEQRFLELRKERIRLASEERTNQANLFSAGISGGLRGSSILQSTLIAERSNLQSQQQFINTQSILLDRATQSAQNPVQQVASNIGATAQPVQQTTPGVV